MIKSLSVVNNENIFFELICYLSISILFIFNIDNGFFWDGVQLGSRHAHFYLNSDFSSLILPNNIDSGHIPTFGICLALIWKYIGKSLIISHLAMFPFIIGIIFQLKKIIKHFVPESSTGLALLLVLLNSTLLSQLTMVIPDVLLIFFFLWGLKSIFDNRYKILPLIIIFLFLTSMRGMMISFCLMLFDLYLNVKVESNKKNLIKKYIPRIFIYFPAFLIFLIFSIYHFKKTGWIGYHKDSPWAVNFERVNATEFFINILKLGSRQIEFGKIGFWIVALFLFIKKFKHLASKKMTKKILILFALFLLIFPLNMLWAKSLLNPRYLIPTYLIFSILTVHLLFTYPIEKYVKLICIIIIVSCFFIGGINIYKKSYNQTWDSTLAHLPYFKIRKEGINYLKSNNIPLEQVGTFFPNIASLEIIDLDNDSQQFEKFNGTNNYLFTSNVYYEYDNKKDIPNYKSIKKIERLGIVIEIYKRIN